MLDPTQLARRAARELADHAPAWVDPHLHLEAAPVGAPEGQPPAIALVQAEQVSTAGDVRCDPAAADAIRRASRVVAVMSHHDDTGGSRITDEPLDEPTARAVVRRIITELCVIDLTDEGLVVREVAPGVSAREVQTRTQAPLWAGPDLSAVEA